LLAANVTWSAALPASTSPTEIAFPFAVENTSGASSLAACTPGTLLSGASLSELTEICRTTAALVSPASLAVKVTLRVSVLGLPLVFW
jgi:hypothetical protein